MSKRHAADPKQLELEYRSIAPRLTAFADELERQLLQLLQAEEVSLGFPLQKRVKSWDSIFEKLARVSLSLSRIGELQDLVGFRIIVLFSRDVAVVERLVAKNFQILKQYDTASRLAIDAFGYSSLHFVISLPESWLSVPTLSSCSGLCAELQIRTVAQHMWAEVSQKLQYKHETSVPPALRRGIYRASALLETVDLEFARLMESRDAYRNDAGAEMSSTPLNVDLLESLLTEMLPPANRENDEQYALALDDLLNFKVATVEDLKELVATHRQSVVELDGRIVEGLRLKKAEFVDRYTTSRSRISSGVFFTHLGLLREILQSAFGADWTEYKKNLPCSWDEDDGDDGDDEDVTESDAS